MEIIQKLSYTIGELPFKYLGIPLATKKLSLIQWHPLIEKIVARIFSWTAKKLSYTGRVQLVQTVLFGIQSYWSQLFNLLMKVMKMIAAYCRSYIWPGINTITKKSLVAWDRMCTPKLRGGYGLINLQMWNRAAIAKLCWDVASKRDSLWIRWIHAYYIKDKRIEDIAIPQQASWMVRQILSARTVLQQIQHRQQAKKSMISQFYYQLLGNSPRVVWNSMMFKNKAKPKVIFTMWVQLQGTLLTAYRLIKSGVNVDPRYSLCQLNDETRDHLFVSCSFTKTVWQKVLQWMRRQEVIGDNWGQHQEWITQRAKGRSYGAQLYIMVYAEVTHGVWIERNMRIFQQRSRSADSIAREIAYICNVRATKGISSLVQHFMFH
ncbi:uncharacterized protein LOC142175548 [Nicotiana tabacum]|uniref:Uncharacterized protein LOC142175548 n=1 Tax=Nicotiana tabacum TaxID=4097 RepID=A0AC58TN57_TOBAC